MARRGRAHGGLRRAVPAALALALLVLAGAMRVNGDGVSAITVADAWARPATAAMPGAMPGMDHGIAGTMASGSSSVAYLTIVNSGDGGDTLTGATTDAAAAVELHRTTLRDNVASMRQVKAVAVPQRGEVRFSPGGYHLVLVNVRRDLRPGDTITLTLLFERAGAIVLTIQVRDA